MNTVQLNGLGAVPAVGLGMMRLPGSENPVSFIRKAIEAGLNFFDHADIYGGGESERIFGRAVSGIARETYIVQSKCGIQRGFYDLSKDHIIASTKASLYRLNLAYLDILLLHRPDALMEPEEVAEAFDTLHSEGIVRHFGVSNMNPMQIQLLQKAVKQPIIVNQMQFSLVESRMVDAGLHVNTASEGALMREGGVLDFCRLNGIIVQAWSPLQYGAIHGVFLDNPEYAVLNDEINRLAERYGVTNTAIALAWILRHPATPQVIVGTVNEARIPALLETDKVTLTRSEWYGLYRTAGKTLP